jgi:hypothetical protein
MHAKDVERDHEARNMEDISEKDALAIQRNNSSAPTQFVTILSISEKIQMSSICLSVCKEFLLNIPTQMSSVCLSVCKEFLLKIPT